MEDRVAFMVHVITGPIDHLSDFVELLPLDPGGPELHRIATNLEEDEMFSSMEIQQGKSINTASESEIVDILCIGSLCMQITAGHTTQVRYGKGPVL